MKITKRQLRRIIKEEKQKLHEVYPIGGETGLDNLEWQTFRDAAYDVAAGFIDAGMEADGIMGAMQDEIESIINEMESTWDDADEADQDHADQEYAAKRGNPWDNPQNEGMLPANMPDTWRQVLGNCLKGKK
jgi:hypothetical protein